ncbi:unnamed protein product [Rhizophagus irregularis]|nr:unnamed protein product [Rhizophagus irregularis]
MVTGLTTQTVKNVDGESVLDFHVEENLGDREPKDFWLEMRHNSNINYLANKTNSINQTMRSTMAILTGLLYYQESVVDTSTSDESTPGKHILKLDDISLISSNRPNTSAQSINLPWLNKSQQVQETHLVRQEDLHHVQKEVVLHFRSYHPLGRLEANH